MTKAELAEALEAADVPFPPDATKADLLALYDELPPPVVQRPQRPRYMTRRQAREWST